ncbi:aldo/keto reductase [Devosia soli]|uniref:Aldo/keto reductase n=1 Tax=Devosia soli TaxID=361041 RepID=A0A0F5LAN5_9HYPH|nr:aldo/keto reductase [Devosia soli]KKB78662.1 aldo/keto reductase [Devosia soli]
MIAKRQLGRKGPSVSPIGMGCWAIGGAFTLDGRQDGWGQVDDAQSVRCIELALDLGANLFDTADAYGTGHSESIIGRALNGRRNQAIIATKFGFTYDERNKVLVAVDVSPSYIEWALAKSLKRLGTDYIDLYQIHVGELTDDAADRAGETLEALASSGRIRAWGWSTDNAAAVRRMLKFPHFAAVQQELSVLADGPEMLALCNEADLASLNRSPLAMGMLSGKFTSNSQLGKDDVRAAGHSWVRFFTDGRPKPETLGAVDALRDLLCTGGRSVAQGALGWNLARSERTIPIPGFKTEAQVRDNLGALEKGPLPAEVMVEIEKILRHGPQDA